MKKFSMTCSCGDVMNVEASTKTAAVNKLKKTCDALEGDIAGFGEEWIVATPNFAYVHRGSQNTQVDEVQEHPSEESTEEDLS